MTQIQSAQPSPFVQSIKSFMLNLFGETPEIHQEIHQRSRDLMNLPDSDVERIAHEVGFSVTDLLACNRGNPKNIELMNRLLAELGIDAEALAREQPGVLQDMERLCGMCKNTQQCRHDLDNADAKSHFTEYCLNTTTIHAIQEK